MARNTGVQGRQHTPKRTNTSEIIANSDKKIFISWSGDISKEIALALKNTIEGSSLGEAGLKCFVSDKDIASGADWWEKVKSELGTCKMGIACITKENSMSPWIHYESGAMVAHELLVIPLLFECKPRVLNKTPLASNQTIIFEETKFIKMFNDINNIFNLCKLSKTDFDQIAKKYYNAFKETIKPLSEQLLKIRYFNTEIYTYPPNITTVNLNTVFISAPMASISEDERNELSEYIQTLTPLIYSLGFHTIDCPVLETQKNEAFDGTTKAIKENFPRLKQVDTMIAIYPKSLPSSTLIEIGYGLALCKRIVIFYKDELPYMLCNAGEDIPHIKTIKYSSYEDITHTIKSNGKQLFDMEGNED